MIGECHDCVKWHRSCNGVQCDPDRAWNGRNGGCSFFSDSPSDEMLGRVHRTPVAVLVGQTSLEAFL